jgi:hypothetical protein
VIDRRCAIPAHRLTRWAGLLWFGFLAALWSVVGARPACAVDFTLAGGAPRPAWSGYWWPFLVTRGWHLYDQTGPFTPLVKYGQATGDFRPLQWERRYKLTTDPSTNWWGHCNGWAAATVLEPEPTRPVRAGSVAFNTGEIKGLLSALHQGDPVDLFRGRPHWNGGNSRTDLRALDFHRAVLYYLRERNETLIFNTSLKPEVWNYPAYAFRMTGVTDPRNPSITHITTTLFFADNDVVPHFVGTNSFTRTYTYWVQGDPRSVNGGVAAEWTGESISSHPQFVWHPAYQRAHEPAFGEPSNPLDYNWVRRLVQGSAAAQ